MSSVRIDIRQTTVATGEVKTLTAIYTMSSPDLSEREILVYSCATLLIPQEQLNNDNPRIVVRSSGGFAFYWQQLGDEFAWIELIGTEVELLRKVELLNSNVDPTEAIDWPVDMRSVTRASVARKWKKSIDIGSCLW